MASRGSSVGRWTITRASGSRTNTSSSRSLANPVSRPARGTRPNAASRSPSPRCPRAGTAPRRRRHAPRGSSRVDAADPVLGVVEGHLERGRALGRRRSSAREAAHDRHDDREVDGQPDRRQRRQAPLAQQRPSEQQDCERERVLDGRLVSSSATHQRVAERQCHRGRDQQADARHGQQRGGAAAPAPAGRRLRCLVVHLARHRRQAFRRDRCAAWLSVPNGLLRVLATYRDSDDVGSRCYAEASRADIGAIYPRAVTSPGQSRPRVLPAVAALPAGGRDPGSVADRARRCLATLDRHPGGVRFPGGAPGLQHRRGTALPALAGSIPVRLRSNRRRAAPARPRSRQAGHAVSDGRDRPSRPAAPSASPPSATAPGAPASSASTSSPASSTVSAGPSIPTSSSGCAPVTTPPCGASRRAGPGRHHRLLHPAGRRPGHVGPHRRRERRQRRLRDGGHPTVRAQPRRLAARAAVRAAPSRS
jgi:hypothetical protein